MADIAGEILKGNLSVVAQGHEKEAGPGGLDMASAMKVGRERDEPEIGGAPNRSRAEISKMIDGIDANLGQRPQIQRVSQRDEGMER
jgi:hypothetical protein